MKSKIRKFGHIGNGKYEGAAKGTCVVDGKPVQYLSSETGVPVVQVRDKYFYLDWCSIFELAKVAGLFDDDKVVEEGKNE